MSEFVPDVHYLLGRLALEKGDVEKAKEHAEKGIRITAEDPTLYTLLARAFFLMDQYKLAVDTIRAGLNKHPRDGAIISLGAAILIEAGSTTEDALSIYRRAYSLEKSNKLLRRQIIRCYERGGRWDEFMVEVLRNEKEDFGSLGWHDKAIDTSQKLGSALFNLGQYDEATAEFEELFRQDGMTGKLYGQLGEIYVARDQFSPHVETILLKAIESDEENNLLFNYLAMKYGETEARHENAMIVYAKVLRNNPEDFRANCMLAKVFFDKKEYKRSLPSVDVVLRADPSNKEFWLMKIVALEGRKRTARAIEAAQMALERFPGDKTFTTLLARLSLKS